LADPTAPWPERLKAQGRSMTWLADQVGVTRSYLSQVAHGARVGSPALLGAIDKALDQHPAPERLDAALDYSIKRSAFLAARDRVAATLAVRLDAAGLAPEEIDEIADDATRTAIGSVIVFLDAVLAS
jgi:transcriptional regulator with XRE-family HTH domain